GKISLTFCRRIISHNTALNLSGNRQEICYRAREGNSALGPNNIDLGGDRIFNLRKELIRSVIQ
ncbi:MAG: hypothetical protein QF408_11365, partial [Pirellulales bacterium]|nr:hypothetical protein [Pirellulales bacterium]